MKKKIACLLLASIIFVILSCDNNTNVDVETNTTLASISIYSTSGIINLGFNSLTTTYHAEVNHEITQVIVTATASTSATSIEISPASPINLAVGNNIITIKTTGAGGKSTIYTIHLTRASNSAKSITYFTFGNLAFCGTTMDSYNYRILTYVPFKTDVRALVPSIIHNGLSISPAIGTKQDFTNPVIYKVTAVDGSTQEYIVTVQCENGIDFDKNADDAFGSMPGQGITNGFTEKLSVCTFTRLGYLFAGWATSSSAALAVYADGSEYTMGNTNVTLYAIWSSNSYTVSYYVNGGINSALNPSTYLTQNPTISLYNPVREYYTFGGWFSDETFTVPVTSIESGSYGNKSFYAKWVPITYSIRYELNGGSNNPANPSSYTNASATISLASPAKTGHTFGGWFSDETFTVPVTSVEAGSYGNKTFYAKWVPITYSISYELNGGSNNPANPSSYTIAAATISLASPTKTGHTFGGWFSDETFTVPVTSIESGSYGNKTLYAKWVPITYSISYELNGGSNNPANPSSYTIAAATISLASPAKTGYTFDGWFSDETFTVPVTSIESGSYGNKTFYAKWIANQGISITISIPGNGSITIGGTISVTKGENVSISVTETYAQYQWYLNAEPLPGGNKKTISINTTGLKAGKHTVTVLVIDSTGNESSGSVIISINN